MSVCVRACVCTIHQHEVLRLVAVGEEQDSVELVCPELHGEVKAPPSTEDLPVQLQVP